MYKDISLNYKNFEDPTSNYTNSFAAFIDINYSTKIDTKLSSIEFSNDQNLIFPDEKEYQLYNMNEIRQYDEKRTASKAKVMAVYIASSNKVTQFSRSYQKIPSFLADVTGLLSQIAFILYFLVLPINERNLTQTVLNSAMKYPNLDYQKMNVNRSLNQDETSRSANKSNLNELKNLKEKSSTLNKRVQLSNFNLIVSQYCCCFSSKRVKNNLKILEKGQEKISFYMNIIVYIKKMQELDILKFLVMNNDQLNIYNFLAGPSVILNDCNNNVYSNFVSVQNDVKMLYDQKKLNEVMRSYDLLKTNQEMNEFNKKLLNLFVDEVEQLKKENL
jgi:hypothetical protein